jgi:uncharacterized protein DUF1761
MSIILLAVIVAVISQIIGWVWHGPIFGKKYSAAVGMSGMVQQGSMNPKAKMAILLVINFIANAVGAFVLFDFLAVFGAFSIPGALLITAFIFVGFILPYLIINTLWNGRSSKSQWTTLGISIGYQLINFAVWAILFGWLK